MSNDGGWVWSLPHSYPVGYPHFWRASWVERATISKEDLQKIPPKMRRRKWIPDHIVFASDPNDEGKRTFCRVPIGECDQLTKQGLRYLEEKCNLHRLSR